MLLIKRINSMKWKKWKIYLLLWENLKMMMNEDYFFKNNNNNIISIFLIKIIK